MRDKVGLGSAALVAVGTLLGQGALLFASPLLTRIYGPETFGLYSTFVAFLGLFSVTCALHWELAIPLPEEKSEAQHVAWIAFACVALTAFLAPCLIVALSVFTDFSYGAHSVPEVLLAMAMAVGLSGINVVLTAWGIRNRSFKRLATSKLAQGAVQAVLQVGIGSINAEVSSLVLGQLAGLAVGAVILMVGAELSLASTLATGSWQRIGKIVRRYRDFAIYSTSSSLVNAGAANLPVLLLAAGHGPSVAGLYALGYRVVQVPIRLVGQSIAQVFLSTAVEQKRKGQLTRATLALYRGLAAFAFPTFAVLMLVAPQLFSVLFGAEWRGAGIFAVYLAPWMAISLIAASLSTLISVLEKQRKETAIQIVYFLATMVSLGLGWMADSVRLTMALLGATGTLVLAWKVVWILNLVELKSREGLKIAITETSIFFPIYLIILWVEAMGASDVWVAAAGGVAIVSIHSFNFFGRRIYKNMLDVSGED
jgi:O-antigen/teichoic acid export membrane protein